MRHVWLCIVVLSSCASEQPLEQALSNYQPEQVAFVVDGAPVSDVEVTAWGDEQRARYAQQVVSKSPQHLSDPRVMLAWKKGMVRAMLEDTIENAEIQVDQETVEKYAVALRTERATPRTERFSAVSIFARNKVDGVQQTEEQKSEAIEAHLAMLSPLREKLLTRPSRETIQAIHKELTAALPPTLGADLKTDARVLGKGEQKSEAAMFHPRLAAILYTAQPGDVPPVERVGATALIVLAEGTEEGAVTLDQEAITKEATDRFLTETRAQMFEEFLKRIYKDAEIRFHPHVIADETAP